jgi:hypothetical protein
MVLDMKVPVNGLAASFFAHLPVPHETRIMHTATEWVRGRFALRSLARVSRPYREVFDDYYKQPTENGVETAPHILFARCPTDADSIIQFTNQWGPLHHPSAVAPMSGFDPNVFTEEERSLEHRHKFFAFTLFWWRNAQRDFQNVVARLANPKWHPSESGGRESVYVSQSTMRLRVVRKRDALTPQVTVDSLLEALWLMLWLDTAERGRTIRICANTKCKNAFRTDRSNRIYCCDHCKVLVNKRKYWHRKGKAKRVDDRSTK